MVSRPESSRLFLQTCERADRCRKEKLFYKLEPPSLDILIRVSVLLNTYRQEIDFIDEQRIHRLALVTSGSTLSGLGPDSLASSYRLLPQREIITVPSH